MPALLRHITKLTAMILVLAAIAASAFIQSVHTEKLRADAAALKLISKRWDAPFTSDARLLESARAWLRTHDPATADSHDRSRHTLAEALAATGVPETAIRDLKLGPTQEPRAAAKWALLRLELGPEGPLEALVPDDAEDDTVAAMLGAFLIASRPTSATAVTGVTLADDFTLGLERAKGLHLESVLLAGDSVDIEFTSLQGPMVANQMPPRTERFQVPATTVRTPAPSTAQLTFGEDDDAQRLAADETRVKRLLRLYGTLSMSEAQSTVSRVLTARFNAVSLFGVQVPAEYFAVALIGGLAGVMAGLVAALRKAREATAGDRRGGGGGGGGGALDFMQSDSISALMLSSGWGRVVLWWLVPVAAGVAVWPDSWVDRAWLVASAGGIVLVGVLGAWALWLGRVTTRGAA